MTAIRWVMVWAMALGVAGARAEKVSTLPAPSDYVEDYADVMSPGGKAAIEAICHDVHLKTKAQVFFVTIKSLEGESIDTFANDLFHKWKIGEQKTDRGVLLLISVEDRKRRIEVGYGLEGILPDAEAGRIGREMIPALQAGDYDQAARIGVWTIANVIANDAKATLNPPPAMAESPPPPSAGGVSATAGGIGFGFAMAVFAIVIFGFFGLIVWAVVHNRRRMRHVDGPSCYDTGASTFTTFEAGDSAREPSSFGGGDSFGSSDSSSGSDIFSGGDGGDSGGGGASGDW